METTPPRSRLSCRTAKLKTGSMPSGSVTPILKTSSKSEQESDYSPVYFPTTQENNEDIDVLWDWHSPQTSQRRRKKQKRMPLVQSPSVPLKRHPSNNNTNFEKLRDELMLLKEELAMPDDESCLVLSPQQEMDFTSNDDLENHMQLISEPEPKSDDINDLFNDSVDEQLVLFSQQIENELLAKKQSTFEAKPQESVLPQQSVFSCDNSEIDELINKYTKKGCDKFENRVNQTRPNSIFNKEPETSITKISNHFTFQRTYSEDQSSKTPRNVIHTMSGKLELHRTKSFEQEIKNSQVNLPKSKLEEIEKNRLEAMAKLALKKKRDISKTNVTQISPSKCSPEEIERKRLQALAKLEAKRLEEIVEKKRQEALKRLQASRMKNANLVKSSLTTRLCH